MATFKELSEAVTALGAVCEAEVGTAVVSAWLQPWLAHGVNDYDGSPLTDAFRRYAEASGIVSIYEGKAAVLKTVAAAEAAKPTKEVK